MKDCCQALFGSAGEMSREESSRSKIGKWIVDITEHGDGRECMA